MKLSVACLRAGLHAEVLASVATGGNALDKDGQPLKLSKEAFRHVPFFYYKLRMKAEARLFDHKGKPISIGPGCTSQSFLNKNGMPIHGSGSRRRSCDGRGEPTA